MNARTGGGIRLPGRWRVLAAGIVAQAAMSALQQGLPVLGPALRAAHDLSLPALGALLAAANWGVALTLLGWGALADRMGEDRVVALGLGGSAVALIAAAFAPDALMLGVALAAAGALSASAIAASGRAVMGWFARDQRGLALGLRQTAVPLGAGLAALALPAAAGFGGLGAAFLALAAAAAVGAISALMFLRPPPTAAPRRIETLPPPLRDPGLWRLSGASGLMLWAQAALSGFFAVALIETHGVPAVWAAALFGAVHVLGAIARVGAGALSDRAGRRVPHLRLHAAALTAALLIAAAGEAASAFGPLGTWAAVATLTLATAMSYAWNGLAFTAVAEMAGHARSGVALGLHGVVMRVISAPAGAVFGMAAAMAGWGWAMAGLAAVVAAAVALLGATAAEEGRRLSH